MTEYIKITGKLNADTFGCDPDYFKKYIKGKPLLIVHSTHTHYVRAQDENQEEWGLFPGEYLVQAGSGVPAADQKIQTEKTDLLPKEAG